MKLNDIGTQQTVYILDMQTDASAKVMDTLYVLAKIRDVQPYYWGAFIGITPLPSINKIIYFFKSILFIYLNL